MKKLIAALVASTLALALQVHAQQDDQQQQEKKKERKKARAEERQGQNASDDQAQRPPAGPGERPAQKRAHAGQRAQNQEAAKTNPAAQPEPTAESQPKAEPQPKAEAEGTAQPAPPPKKGHRQGNKGQPPPAPQAAATAAPAKAAPPVQAAGTAAPAKPAPAAQAAAATAPTAQKNPQRKAAAEAKKPDIATIKSRNANFHAQPKPETVVSVTFVENRTIVGAQNWQGQRYNAFRSYHSIRHDRAWYASHYPRVVLIGGGYYYFNAGYWYPAWGYAPTQQYYAYDGPIYAGRQAEPPDKVIADVQSSLQEMGYYTGEVDGLLGPLTREALNGYQADYDLTVTGAIDEPTLEALGMA
ncbi:MAG: peptidoglycan-binding protein [Chthoniobacterales bacterium]|nr:peptidoglycan-binding protein [Chthoniobacterales bacterium]